MILVVSDSIAGEQLLHKQLFHCVKYDDHGDDGGDASAPERTIGIVAVRHSQSYRRLESIAALNREAAATTERSLLLSCLHFSSSLFYFMK